MQQVASRWKWGFLATVLAVFALAFSLFAAAPAQAADDYAAGDGDLTVQDEKSKDEATAQWPLQVYLKVGDGEAKLQKEYTQEQFEALKSSGDPVSVFASAQKKNKVFTAQEYVAIDDLLVDAGISNYWVSSSYLEFEASDGGNGYTYPYDDVTAYKFFPNTASSSLDSSDAVNVPLVLGIRIADAAIGDDQTAKDVAEENAKAEGSTEDEPRVIAGSTSEDYLAGNAAGKRLWGKTCKVTLSVTQEAKDQADADAVWPFKVYVQSGNGTPTLVKEYTKEQFTALAVTDGDPISGLYNKSGWNVSTAVTYVPLDALLADAGVSWDKGATIGYGGDPAQGKSSNSFTYEDLKNTFFYPNTTTGKADTSEAVAAPFVFGLKTSNGGVKIGDDQTAADVQKAAADGTVETAAPYAIFGSLEAEYASEDGGATTAGKRLWRNVDSITITYSDETQKMHRLYNQYSGEHFYTADDDEFDGLVKLGWTDEGTGWTAPLISSTPVYRLYNPYAGEHHYTMKADERDNLVKIGWTDEGVGWYSDDAEGVVLYREYNPNETANNHNYTTDKAEHDNLVSLGWTDEGTAWYGVKTA